MACIAKRQVMIPGAPRQSGQNRLAYLALANLKIVAINPFWVFVPFHAGRRRRAIHDEQRSVLGRLIDAQVPDRERRLDQRESTSRERPLKRHPPTKLPDFFKHDQATLRQQACRQSVQPESESGTLLELALQAARLRAIEGPPSNTGQTRVVLR